jgi:YidC/Oxa1 family membrane protein insertase
MGYFEAFSAALVGFFALVPSYGLAIILLTLAARVLLLPLSIKQTRSMREMQRIQPELKKLQAKYKGNRQKMTEAQMALYKEHGVNPLGGCAPLLLQMPVLFGLFHVLREPLKYMGYKAVETAGSLSFEPQQVSGFMARLQDSHLARELFENPLPVHQFLGLRLDCSSSLVLRGQGTEIIDRACGTGLLSALPYLVLVVAMGASTYYQQRQMQATQNAAGMNPQAQQMQAFMKYMPLMLVFFAFSFPSGLVVYWLTTNLWTIIQQRIVLKAVPVAPPPDKAPTPAPGKEPSGDKPGGPARRPAKKSTAKEKRPVGKPGASAATGGNRPTGRKKRKR